MADQERSIAGERIVVTGGTNGIGKEIARALVRRGAAVTLLARNELKAARTAGELAVEKGALGDVDVVEGDLGDLATIRRAAEEIRERYDTIDVLVNNAGIHATASKTTVDGFDHTMATNHLGPFLLTNLLLDRLKAGAPARIVTTASEAHRGAGRVPLDKLAAATEYGKPGSEIHYAQSKLANILFTQELARRLEGTGVTANCFCPGFVDTSLSQDSALASTFISLLSTVGIASEPEKGAQLGVRLVTDPTLSTTTGKFFTTTPGLRFVPMMPITKDFVYQRRLWDRSAELVGLS